MDYSCIHPKVYELQEFDQAHHSSYLKTLYTYLDNERHIKRTASELQIHRNTLLQRISRLTEDFKINFDDSNECFYLLLSLRILQQSSNNTKQR